MQVQFFFLSAKASLNERKRLKAFIPSIFRMHKRKLLHLNYIFCTDEYLLDINKKHLNHDYYTDIITFDLSTNKDEINGEIYISLDRVKENAQTLRKPVKEELHRVIFHGALHLCGYQDKKKHEIKEMRAAEDDLLLKYFKN